VGEVQALADLAVRQALGRQLSDLELLAERSTADQAARANGPDAAEGLREGGLRHGEELVERSMRSSTAFARPCRRRADMRAA
jgi:hypothetical protein